MTRRRHDRIHAGERPGPQPEHGPEAGPSAGDPRERSAYTGMRPYEATYQISSGYTADRTIVLP